MEKPTRNRCFAMIYPNKTQQEKAARKFQGKTLKKGIWKGREVEFAPDEILIKIKPGKERDEIFLKKLFSGKLEKSKLKRKFDKSGIGVIGLDVFTQESDPFLQVINGVFRFQNHTVNRDHTIIGKVFD